MRTKHLVVGTILGATSMVGVLAPDPVAADTFTVTNTAAAGDGSLSEAFDDANANAGPDTITFAPTVTGVIDIGATTLGSNDSLTITGPGSDVLAITNTIAAPILQATAGAFEVTGLTLNNTDGNALVAGGVTNVTINDVTVDSVGGIAITIGATGAINITQLKINDAPVGLKVTSADSVVLNDISVSKAAGIGVLVAAVTNDVSINDIELTQVEGSVLIVDTTGGAVTIDGISITKSAGSVVVDGAASVALSNASDIDLFGPLVIHNVVGATTLTNMAGAVGIQLSNLGSAELDNVHVTGNFAAPTHDVSTITGTVEISESSFGTAAFGAPMNLTSIGGSLLIDRSDFTMSTVAISVVTGDLTLTETNIETSFGMAAIDSVGGNVLIDDSSISSLNLTTVTGTARLVDARLGDSGGLPVAGLFAGALTDLSLERVTVGGGGTSISSMAAASAIDIDDSIFSSPQGLPLAIDSSPTTDLTIDGTTIAGTTAGLTLDTLQSATITNTTITGSGGLGGSALDVADTPTAIVNTTISGNSGFGVFALATNSAVTIENSIIAGNAGSEFDITPPGTITATSSILTPDTDTPILGTNNVRIDDPQLADLADNGGLTSTMLPLTGSPAIDTGDGSLIGAPAVDQRGFARPVGQIDIGAVEVDNGAISVSNITVDETDGIAQVTFTRSGAGDADASVDVATADGTATAGDDYTATTTTVTWASGDAAPKTIDIPVLTDSLLEGDETFTVSVTNPTTTSASSLLSVTVPSATVTITDVPPGPAISSIAPARFVDTRPGQTTTDGRYAGVGKRGADTELEVIIAGRGGVPADARGVVMNITAIGAEGVGFATAHPCVSPRPNASSLNVTAGVNLGNEVVAGLSSDGSVCMYTSVGAHLTVDVVGYIGADSPTSPVTPARILDTRGNGETVDGQFEGSGKTTAGGQIDLDVAGRGGIPAGAEAVILNVTAIGATSNGFATVHPCVSPVPTASSLNFVAGVNRGNELIVSLNASGQSCLSTSAAIHLTADVVGYIPAGTNYSAVGPARLLETRSGQSTIDGDDAGVGALEADTEYELQVAGRGGVPADASAAIVNLTAIGASGSGFITMHPCVEPRPNASSLNYVAGVNGGNEVVAQLSASGTVCIYTSAGTHVTVDVVGALG